MYKGFERLFHFLVFLFCLGIVTLECWRCWTKFLSEPEGTHISIINTVGNEMFPSIIVCPYPNKKKGLNSIVFSECGIRGGNYFDEAKWSNQSIKKCANPRSLFQKIIWKLTDLMNYFEVHFFNLFSVNITLKDTKSFHHIDSIKKCGQCNTFILSSNIILKKRNL